MSANLTIKGSTTGQTVIDGNFLDREFHVLSGKVAISNVVIENGMAAGEGGGILNSGGTVTLTSVQLSNNVAAGANGAAGTNGGPGNTQGQPGGAGTRGEGGGIFNAAGSLTLNDCVISMNWAAGGNGGTGGNGGLGNNTSGLSGVRLVRPT